MMKLNISYWLLSFLVDLSLIGRSPWQRFPDHAFMPHCTFSPHLLAQQGVRRAPEVEGALTGGI